ncbi:MAG: N-acyl homoserine lactonase family protein [Archaeoglobus sp.]|nr:N-acyl homoserine lactonase family protein [Archaeoglobus sp.]
MYRIKPLKQGEIMAPMGVLQILGDMSTLIVAPIYVWLIEGENRKIIVDAGIEEPVDGFVHGFPVSGGGEEGLRKALESENMKPEDIDTLILTHLHFDHVATTNLFHNARVYVQKKEWESAFNPPMHYRATYDANLFQCLEGMDLCLVDGDACVADGIELILLPGHTKGLQGVAVQTEGGKYLIAGDHFYSFLNLNPPKEPVKIEDLQGNKIEIQPSPIPFLPPGLHVDLSEWFDSCFKALSVTSRKNILPGHEPSLVGKQFP